MRSCDAIEHASPIEGQTPVDFFGLEIPEAEEKLGSLLGKRYHGSSFVSFVYKHFVTDVEAMTSLPAGLRPMVKDLVPLHGLPVVQRLVSTDGTVKFLLGVETDKGPQEIECVYIPEKDRVTLCVSSQVGCKMACKFCLTAQLGFKTHLKASDIVRQVWTVLNDTQLRRVTNIVFMGMGEPFDNFEEVRKATRILSHQKGLDLSARKITVSTVGKVDKIDALTKEDPFRLAVSLNATTDAIRTEIMPINHRWPIEELMRACRDYSVRTNKRVTFEYILMKGISDSPDDARRLIQLTAQVPCKINLIPYNESEFTEFKRPDDATIMRFHAAVLKSESPVFIRKNRGNDIYAACGMLKKVQPAASV